MINGTYRHFQLAHGRLEVVFLAVGKQILHVDQTTLTFTRKVQLEDLIQVRIEVVFTFKPLAEQLKLLIVWTLLSHGVYYLIEIRKL